MFLRKKPSDAKIQSRVQRLSDQDLIAWADQALYSIGRNLTSYQREGAPEFLEEASMGAQVLLETVTEISRRSER